ncbi:MAG: ABC transporter ATP-binding protein [Deltaproteobacteria bacterium RBG_13_49_15]|nr:MAG: ABC transporter ATP-binding protein [Deltaproteobacteria bacterium RBG_13_49_15]
MIALENLTKSYGDRVLFDRVSVKINPKERIGLVGRNGHGKTTLFRIIIGEEEYDSGTFSTPKNYRVGHVRQQFLFHENTVLAEGMRDLPPTEKDHHWKVEKILAGLGFSSLDLDRRPNELSGGFQVRLNLAKVLISEPDLLLLDEPTNFLDITSIRWIERFLLNWRHELLLITHDRSFMDKIVTHTMGIHRNKIRKIAGITEKYYAQIAQDEEVFEKTRQNEERRSREIEQFITRFRAKARLAGLVQSRVKTLAKLEKKNRLEKMRDLEFSFRTKPFRGKHVLGVHGLFFAYSKEKPLFQNLEFSLNAGERLCVVGPNGKGKTTLLRLLAGRLKPIKGEISYHPDISNGFYEQTNVEILNNNHTVVQEIQCSHPDMDYQQARNISGAMLFEGDEALKKISVLSGGEKARVILGKIIATPVNLLLLDEPGNHLDMESCDALLAAIDDFEGTVIMVTHNEMFLHALAQRLIVFQEDRVSVFDGTYQDFLNKGGWRDENLDKPASQLCEETINGGTKRNKKALRRQRSEVLGERVRLLKPIEQSIAEAEAEIEAEEERLTEMSESIAIAAREQEGTRIAELSRQIHQSRSSIEKRFLELEQLYPRKEALQTEFDGRLAELEGLLTLS